MQVTTMASSAVATNPTQHHMDRLDAARALLGVSPQAPESNFSRSNSISNSSQSPSSPSASGSLSHGTTSKHFSSSPTNRTASTSSYTSSSSDAKNVSFEKPAETSASEVKSALSSSSSSSPLNGLDALAALASKEQASMEGSVPRFVSSSTTSSSDSNNHNHNDGNNEGDSEAMPPPPPRSGGRRRSVSNPEGMEKWAPYSDYKSSRRHFVLPASILEEELAEASAAMEAHERTGHGSKGEKNNTCGSLPFKKRGDSFGNEDDFHSDSSASGGESSSKQQPSKAPISGLMSADEQANLSPEELLKRARSRLLEDLSEGSLNGEKGVLTLPHSLAKYKEVYNKNGRIGIYTPAERAAIIARFQRKRSRRVWNKKIRYNCRKNLADRRMRVKGRFVKRSTEQMAKAKQGEEQDKAAQEGEGGPLETQDSSEHADEDMPDVNDPDAGFCPTEDQPYRRTRRHTIT